jgi:hypothetical protein
MYIDYFLANPTAHSAFGPNFVAGIAPSTELSTTFVDNVGN